MTSKIVAWGGVRSGERNSVASDHRGLTPVERGETDTVLESEACVHTKRSGAIELGDVPWREEVQAGGSGKYHSLARLGTQRIARRRDCENIRPR